MTLSQPTLRPLVGPTNERAAPCVWVTGAHCSEVSWVPGKHVFHPNYAPSLGWSSGEVAVFIVLLSLHPSVGLNRPHMLPQTPPCPEASLSPHSGPGSRSPGSPRRPPRRVREVSRTMLCQKGAAVPRSAAPTTRNGVGAPETRLENKARAGKTPDFTLKTTRLCGHKLFPFRVICLLLQGQMRS